MTIDTPKSKKWARDVSLDAETTRLLREHRKAQLGHSTTQITADVYQHVRRVKADDAAEKVAALLPPRKAAQ
jgi:integrase